MKISSENYNKQFKEKKDIFNSYFNEVTVKNIFPSNYHSFRHRCEFGVSNSEHGINYSMIKDNRRIEIDKYPICSESIQELMKELLEMVNREEVLYRKLFQIEFQSSRSKEIMVSLIYHLHNFLETKGVDECPQGLLFPIRLVQKRNEVICLWSNLKINFVS